MINRVHISALIKNLVPGYLATKCCLLLIFILPFAVSSQIPYLKFKTFNPSLFADAAFENIFVSRSGKLWFSCARGLASFDGSSVAFYNQPDELSIVGTTLISCMAEDSRGNFWIGTNHKGVSFFESTTGKFRKLSLLLKNDSSERRIGIQSIFIEADSSIWIATTQYGFFIHNPVKGITKHYNLDMNQPEVWPNRYRNTPNHFVRDPSDKNKIWIGAYDGIYSINRSGNNLMKEYKVPVGIEEKEGLPASFCRIQKIDLPGNDTIWFSTWSKGMGYCDMRTGNTKLFPNNKTENNPRAKNLIIESFCRRSEHEYYVACRNYLPAIFNTRTRQYYFLDDELIDKAGLYTYSIETGNNNTLWVSMGGGLFFHSPLYQLYDNIDATYQLVPDLRTNLMRDIIWDDDNKVYYASVENSSGVYVLDSLLRIIKILAFPKIAGDKSDEVYIKKTLKDGSGRLWALGEFLFVMQKDSKEFETASKLFSHNNLFEKRVRDAAQRGIMTADLDDKGNLLLLSENKIYIIDHENLLVDSIHLKEDSTAVDLAMEVNILTDKKKRLIYASGKKAIYQYNLQTNETRRLVYDPSLRNSFPEKTIVSFALDGKGNLWVSFAEYGIRIYDPVSLEYSKEMTLQNSGIPLNTTLKNGGSEFMLIESNAGIFMYDINKHIFQKLNIENGMKFNKPWGAAVVNNILFLGMQDIIQYMPLKKLSELKKTVSPYISGLRVAGFPVRSDTLVDHLRLLKLSHRQRTISFDFSAIEFEFPERIQYAYKLEGVDETWNLTDSYNRTITYSNLAPGKYLFRVKAQFQSEEPGKEEKKILIVIGAPYWETWWFKLLALTVTAILLSLIVNYRIRQVRKKAWTHHQLQELEMKALKAQMNPHFIYNALNSIQALVLGQKTNEATFYISKFGRLLRQVLTNSDKAVITLENELQTLELYMELEKLRMNMELNYFINIHEDVNTSAILVPPLIYQPFVENAIWHGLSNKKGEKKINISLTIDDGCLKTMIEDNGIGRIKASEMKHEQKHPASSKGIEITARRLTQYNNTPAVDPVIITDLYDREYPTGTRVGIKIKLAD